MNGSGLTCARMHDESKPPVIRELDFSEFHPIDHWPGSARCRSLPGGTRNHLELTWTFRWKPWLASKTLCRVGRHRWVQCWRTGSDESFTLCNNCDRSQPLTSGGAAGS